MYSEALQPLLWGFLYQYTVAICYCYFYFVIFNFLRWI